MKKKENDNRPAARIKQLAQWYIDHKAFRGMNTFEMACGLSPRYVKNIYATEKGNPSVDVIAHIYRTFKGVSLEWLVLGDGNMFTVSDAMAIRYAKDATGELKKEQKIRSVLNNNILKGMSREEKLELVSRMLEEDK